MKFFPPTVAAGIPNALAISGGPEFGGVCALLATGSVVCWVAPGDTPAAIPW